MKLLYYPDDSLKKICIPVTSFDGNLHSILDEMKVIMSDAQGLGLSANQVGIHQQIFIMKDNKEKVWEFINPVILFKDDIQYLSEGCLSLPGVTVDIPRAKQVSVEAYDRNGVKFNVGAYGVEAVCIQHEMDHLSGVFFLDLVSRPQRRDAIKQYNKGKKNEV